MITMEFPWFDRKLSPNTKCHWAVKSKAQKKQKEDAFYIAKSHPLPAQQDQYVLDITFHPKTNHRQDLDNCIASIKGLLDGVALAWEVDDSLFHIVPVMGDKVLNGKIVISLK